MIIQEKGKQLILIDCYGFIFRAYYVLKELTTSDGTPIGAIQGFITMLHKILFSKINSNSNKMVAAILDKSSRSSTFRHKIYPQYKQHRPELPQDIIRQFSILREMLTAFGVKYIEEDGFEADDVIASYSRYAVNNGYQVTIISGDKDFFQLLTHPAINIYDPVKSKLVDALTVEEKLGIAPEKALDYFALIGDSADNVPGIKGIGPVSAVKLLQRYGSLDNIYSQPIIGVSAKLKELIDNGKDMALMSRDLVKLKDDIAPRYTLEELAWDGLNSFQPSISSFLHKYELQSLERKLGLYLERQSYPISSGIPGIINNKPQNKTNTGDLAPLLKAAEWEGVVTITLTKQDWDNNNSKNYFSLTENSLTPEAYNELSEISGSIEYDVKEAPAHIIISTEGLYFVLDAKQLQQPETLAPLRQILESNSIHKIIINSKALINYIQGYSINHINGYDDLLIMDYTIGTGRPNTLLSLWERYGKHYLLDNRDNLNTRPYLRLHRIILHSYYEALRQIHSASQIYLYESIDKVLNKLLIEVEHHGIKINESYLKEAETLLTKRMNEIAEQLYAKVGGSFNIASPKQVEEVLTQQIHHETIKSIFGKPKLPDTTAETLEQLALYDIDIATDIITWRQLAKISGTYIKGLLCTGKDGRVHCQFHAIKTLTGRLSASNPNLQSVPTESIEGVTIRKAIIAKEGYLLLSADYSQIELRFMALIANIEPLKQAMREGKDMHAITASHVFKIPMENITEQWRKRAKAINFGIIYGISKYGLARNIGTDKETAQRYIDEYLNTYPGIRQYMDNTIAKAREYGYVSTILGRKCYIPAIHSGNKTIRNMGERTAINAIIQGSAADLIRAAMVKLPQRLQDMLILQVHDELIFEVPMIHAERIRAEVTEIMQNAIPNLEIPIKVNTTLSREWS